MTQTVKTLFAMAFIVCFVAAGCRQDSPTEHVDKPTDKAAEAIERAITTPIEKAKAVESTLQKAADRTAEQSQKAGE